MARRFEELKMEKLNIAFLPALKRPITLQTTASRNRVIVDLATGLTKKGHRVTIFGTSNSQLPGIEIVGVIPKGIIELGQFENPFYAETAYIVHAITKLVSRQGEFDIVHNHMYPEFLPLLSISRFKTPIVTTIHAQVTEEFKMAISDTKDSSKLVSISQSAQSALGLNSTVVYNGIDTEFFTPLEHGDNRKNSYILFVGRMSKAKDKQGNFLDPKGVQNAIKVAQNSWESLKIVGNVEDKEFYDELVKPHLSSKMQFIGEVSSEQKLTREELKELYQNAKAFLFPVNWEEPFGLVMAEAMACGTPVIAFNRGSVLEIVINGLTGYVVDYNSGIDGLVEAVKKINLMSRKDYQEMRKDCRKRVRDNFSIEKMVEDYEKLYYKIIKR